jgi:hypothetical protein
MNDDQERPDSEEAPTVRPATGVATGNLGTASNLEDTQVYRIADLVEEEPVDAVPPPEQISDAAPIDAATNPAAPVAPVQAVAARHPRRRRIAGPAMPFRRQPVARMAGLAAAAAVLVLGAFVILSSGGGLAGGPGQAASTDVGAAATVEPTAAPDGSEKGDGKGKGNGKGNGGKND